MSFGPLEIGLVLTIVLLIFGGKKLKSLGSDLGEAIKGFKSTMGGEKDKNTVETSEETETDPKPKTAD